MEPRQTKKTRRRYLSWINTLKFRRFTNRLHKPVKRFDILGQISRQRHTDAMRKYYRAIASEGEVGIGVLMYGNELLRDKDSAAPALLLGTTDFSRPGFSYLWQVAQMITHLDETNDESPSGRFVSEVYGDLDFQYCRVRRLPAELDETSRIAFYDIQIQAEDLVSNDHFGMQIIVPISTFLVTPSLEGGAIIIPTHIAKPLIQSLR